MMWGQTNSIGLWKKNCNVTIFGQQTFFPIRHILRRGAYINYVIGLHLPNFSNCSKYKLTHLRNYLSLSQNFQIFQYSTFTFRHNCRFYIFTTSLGRHSGQLVSPTWRRSRFRFLASAVLCGV